MEISGLLNVHLNNYPMSDRLSFSKLAAIQDDSFEISTHSQKRRTQVDKIISEMEDTVADVYKGTYTFHYPQMFKNRIMNADFKLGNWDISTGEFFVRTQMESLKEKFGINNLVPFAIEENSNMIACFVIDEHNSGKVVEFDAYGSPENIDIAKYNNFEDWVFKKL